MSIHTAREIASKTELTLAEKLSYHLALCFASPLNPNIIPLLCEAIERFDAGADMSVELLLPTGVTYNGRPTAPANALFSEYQLSFYSTVAVTR